MLTLDKVDLSLGGRPVIRGVSFHVNKGELVCLLGPSGCGKTSTLRLIAGLERPDDGTISIDGETVSTRESVTPPHRRKIGFLFQDFALFPHLTVAENIAYGLTGVSKTYAAGRTKELLEQIRLLDHADKYPHMLSGGEQQRVALARARAPRPPLLLLDEPFSGLDTSLRASIREETLAILKDRGVTTVMVTHDPEEAMLMADRIILMKDGQVIQTGTPDELYNHPQSVFTAAFFGEINRLEGTVSGNLIKTDIGSLTNRDFDDGTTVDVLIRPQGLTVSASNLDKPEMQMARVCDVRSTGGSNLIRVGIGLGSKPHTHIQAAHTRTADLKEGDTLNVEIDPKQAFIFQRSDP